MLFLGIFFVTSWISGFLSLNQIAVNVPSQIPTVKLSSSSEKDTSNQFCSATGSNNESSTLIPKALNAVKTSVSSTPQFLKSNDYDSDFPNKILRSIREGLPPTLRNLFRLPISFESPKRSSNLSVVTVRRDETNYEVWLDNHLIANLPNQLQASVMQQRLNKLLQSKVSDPSQLRPATANGETYNQNDLTVAHKTLPFNTHLKVTYKTTGKSVIVRVNDRGPYIPPRSLDLSLAAARCIGSETAGVVSYEAVIMQPNQPKMTLNAPLALRDKKKPQQLAVVSEF